MSVIIEQVFFSFFRLSSSSMSSTVFMLRIVSHAFEKVIKRRKEYRWPKILLSCDSNKVISFIFHQVNRHTFWVISFQWYFCAIMSHTELKIYMLTEKLPNCAKSKHKNSCYALFFCDALAKVNYAISVMSVPFWTHTNKTTKKKKESRFLSRGLLFSDSFWCNKQ